MKNHSPFKLSYAEYHICYIYLSTHIITQNMHDILSFKSFKSLQPLRRTSMANNYANIPFMVINIVTDVLTSTCVIPLSIIPSPSLYKAK